MSPCSPEPKSGPRWSDDPDLAALQRAMRGGWEDPRRRTSFGWDTALPLGCLVPLVILSVPFMVAWGLVSERRQRADLRRQLAEIPPERLHAVLRMLREEPPSSGRRMAETILRRMEIPTEVSPAAPPDGRGDEPSAEAGDAPRSPAELSGSGDRL